MFFCGPNLGQKDKGAKLLCTSTDTSYYFHTCISNQRKKNVHVFAQAIIQSKPNVHRFCECDKGH